MKLHKRALKVAVVSAITVAFAVPAFANPFSDVPAKHWSYDSVNQLAQAGVIDGYGDGTFKGDKTMTRYEMAQIVGKAMTKTLNAAQQANVDKLSQEYASELNAMGIKVDGMQNQIDNMVKISGDARVRYTEAGDRGEQTDGRARVALDAKVNDNLGFHTRVSGEYNLNDSNNNNSNIDGELDTANVTFKALGLNNTLGRQDVILGSGILFDDTMNGLATQAGGLTLYAGKTTGGVNNALYANRINAVGPEIEADNMYGAEYKVGIKGASLTADYLKNGDNKAYGINGAIPIGKALTANADYVKNDTNNASAVAYGVKFNQLGLTATHRDADAGVYNAYSSSDSFALPTDVAIKGMEYQYDKNLAKNVDMLVKYQDFDNMDTRTTAAVNVKF